MNKYGLIIFCIIPCFLAGCLEGDKSDKKFTRRIQLSEQVAINSFQVINQVGNLEIRGEDTDTIHIDAKVIAKAGTDERAKKLANQTKISISQKNDLAEIVIQRMEKQKEENIKVDLKITIPSDVNGIVDLNVGEIRVSNLKGTLNLNNNVGNIYARDVLNKISASSSVGDMKVYYAAHAEKEIQADLQTNVGSILLQTPENISAEVFISSQVGSISVPYDLNIRGKSAEGRTAKGTIGQGEGQVRVKTNVGSIKIVD